MAPRRTSAPGGYLLRVRRSRNGRGVFAQEPIPKGACIIEYTGRPATPKQIADDTGRYLFEISRTLTIDGNVAGNTARFINHSCAPNCEARIRNRRVFIHTLRTIRAGEELTYDYGEEYFAMHFSNGRCRCAKCAP